MILFYIDSHEIFECFTLPWKCDSILYVFENDLSMLICIHSVGIEMFGLHELILYVFEDYFSKLLCIHSVDI